ncbi:acetamidase/formamidase family protein [Microbacterium tumbae]
MTQTTLQADAQSARADHYLPSRADEVRWGWLPNATSAPVLEVRSGETVTIDTLSHEGLLEDQGRNPIEYLAQFDVPAEGVLRDAVEVAAHVPHAVEDGPHIVTGPVAVSGAAPGDLLKVEILGLERRVPYGFISSRHGFGALPGEYPEDRDSAATRAQDRLVSMGTVSYFCSVDPTGSSASFDTGAGRRLGFALAPFLGLMGVAPATDAPVPSVPPGLHGGNIDIKHLTAGTTLYLPVQVAGALFYTGDPHFAQGNGEVALTALEASLRAHLRLTVLSGSSADAASGALRSVFGETSAHWIATGMDEDLDEAMRKAVRAAIEFLHTRHQVPRPAALAYLSAAGDFEISQVVDAVKGVHCLIRKADFAAWS